MDVKAFVDALGVDFYTGVPDSQLKALCDYLMTREGISDRHIIAANEGNCTALAAGYHLATGKAPMVYMQNSGIGNVINPLASLLHDDVYGIPCIFVIGWRGEPGTKDEPQHVYQGKATLPLLEAMGVEAFVLSKDTTEEALQETMTRFRRVLADGRCVAFVVRKGALSNDVANTYQNGHEMVREEILRHIVSAARDDLIVSTTGKISRELFEIREANQQNHAHDFLTVGSMGHCSSIALGIALQKPNRRVWCIDGDGAALMHMGAMAVIGARRPANLIHVVINNGAHETVGGMPTVAEHADWLKIAEGCGYPSVLRAANYAALDEALAKAVASKALCFVEVKAGLSSRADLGRPTTTAKENKVGFMREVDRT